MNPFADLADEQLMSQYSQGEQAAFEILYKRHNAKVYRYLSKRLKNESDIAEVFQNVFLKMHKSRSRFDDKYSFMQWLFTITRSELLDFCKKRQIKTVPLLDEPAEEKKSTAEFDLAAIPGLNHREKETIAMRYFSNLEYDEISKAMGTTPANTRKILSRGLGKIKNFFREKGEIK